MRAPIRLPPIVARDNDDGTYSIPCWCVGFMHWHVVRQLSDLPEWYLTPPSRAVPSPNCEEVL